MTDKPQNMKTDSQLKIAANGRHGDFIDSVLWWIFTVSIIPVGWHFYDMVGNNGLGRSIVGFTNALNGMAIAWMIQAWRHRPNAKRAASEPNPCPSVSIRG